MKSGRYIPFIVLLVVTVILWQACKPEESGPPTPSLTFESYSKVKRQDGKDSILIITMTFTDGDGDIGLTEQDSVYPFRYGQRFFYNLFAEFYAINNGVPGKLRNPFLLNDTIYKDTVTYSQRIKNLTPEGRDKAIKGKIELLAPFDILDPSVLPDSAYMEIQLFDRKLNSSNIVRTPVIPLDF